MNRRGLTERQKALGAFTAVCIIWGTTYLGIRVTLETMPPFVMAGLRWVIAGLLMAIPLHRSGRPLPPLRAWRAVAVMAFLLLVLGNGAVVWAEQYVTSGLTAVVIASNPFWMVGAEALVGGERASGRAMTGLTVGFLGIVLLVWPELNGATAGGERFLAGIIALQIACAGWAAGSSWSKRHTLVHDVFMTTALQMLLAGVMLLAIGSALGEWQVLHFSARSATAFIYLTTVGAIGGFAAYAYALKHLPMAFVSLYAYVNPIIAVILGVLVLGEPFSTRMALAAAIVLVGVAIVRSPGRPPVATAAGERLSQAATMNESR
jgi:drug/metabolite transporter (DMT)-like permease